jgi:DNA-binding response OmpR family regulator
MRILVVDDDPAVQFLLGDFLTGEGYEVPSAADGAAALASVAATPPALILLDLTMPGMDGRTFIQELRTRKHTVPFIVMTGAGDAHTVAAELGATEAMAKPLSLPLLLARIGAIMR